LQAATDYRKRNPTQQKKRVTKFDECLALDDYGSPLFLENQKSDALKYKTTDV